MIRIAIRNSLRLTQKAKFCFSVKDQITLENEGIKELIDYEGALLHFKQRNDELRNPQQTQQIIEGNLQKLLGKNYPKITTQLPIKQPPQTLGYTYKGLRAQYPQAEEYPIPNLHEVFKPEEPVRSLQENQLAIFNIPLNVDESDVQQFILDHLKVTPKVAIHNCKLGLNSYAVATFEQPHREFKNALHLLRFNDCVLDVKSIEDADLENAWDRTIVVTNLREDSSQTEILQELSEYGRIQDFYIPHRNENEPIPLYETLIEELEKANTKEPVKLEIYNIETNNIENAFWPSEEDYMTFHKSQKRLDETQLEYQQRISEEQDEQRMSYLSASKSYRCVKVPFYFRYKYQQFIRTGRFNDERAEDKQLTDMLRHIYTPKHTHMGFGLVTYSTKLMAQRALYNMALLSTKEIGLLKIPLINQPVFKRRDNRFQHGLAEKYGHNFPIENLFRRELPHIRPLKAWREMELYEVDAQYIINQIANIRDKQVATLQKINNQVYNKREEDEIELEEDEFYVKNLTDQRREDLRQRILKELAEPETSKQFDEVVMQRNFSPHQELFEENYQPILSSQPGRRFEADVLEDELKSLLDNLSKTQLSQNVRERTFTEYILQKNQKEVIDAKFQPKTLILEGDPSEKELYARKVDRLIQVNKDTENLLAPFDDLRDATKEYIREVQTAEQMIQRHQARINKNKKQEPPGDDTPSQEFCTFKEVSHHQQFINRLKRYIYGTLTDLERSQVFSFVTSTVDPLFYAKNHTKDLFDNNYLTDEIIDQIKQIDLPQESDQRVLIRKQEANRNQLLKNIPKSTIEHIKQNVKFQVTDMVLDYLRNGHPTESFEVEDGFDAQQLTDQLNQFVASSNESYQWEFDPVTKKKYIVKTEKEYFKYDLGLISQINQDEAHEDVIDLLIEMRGLTRKEATDIVEQQRKTGEISPIVKELFYELKTDLQDVDVEQVCRDLNISKKELELHLNNDIFNERERYNREIAQQYTMQKKILEYEELNSKNVIVERESQYKIKDQSGQFIVPKYKKI